MALPNISAYEVDAILDGLSSSKPNTISISTDCNHKSAISREISYKSKFTEKSSIFQAENLAKLGESDTANFIGSGLDIKVQVSPPKVTNSTSNILVPIRNNAKGDSTYLNDHIISVSTNQCNAQTKKCVITSVQRGHSPYTYKCAFISNDSYSFGAPKTSGVSINATSLRDRSPIGSLDLATQSDFRPVSVNKIGSREANWAIRVAGLPRIQNTKSKASSVSSHATTPKTCTPLNSPEDTPIQSYAITNSIHHTAAVHGLSPSSSGCDDRFKHICPYPHCGRRYQAEFGLLRHLGKYHLDRVELPQRKRPSMMARHASHRRPASEERPIASSRMHQTDDTASLEATHRQYSPRTAAMSNIRVIGTVSGEERSIYLGNSGGTPSVRLLPAEQNDLPNKVSDTPFRLRIIPPRRINYSSNRSVSLTEETITIDSPNVTYHIRSPNRPRSVSGDVQPQPDNSPLHVKPQNRHKSDGSSPVSFQGSAYAACIPHCQHSSCQCPLAKLKTPSSSWDDTHVNLGGNPVCSSSSSVLHSSVATASDDEQFTDNRRRTWSVGAGLHCREVASGKPVGTALSHHCISVGKTSRLVLGKPIAASPRSLRVGQVNGSHLRTSTSDDECTKQMEFMSGVHALTYSKNDSITCPIDGCVHISSGRADLSAHLTGIHFPEVKNQLVRLIFACPVKDCPTVCDDEVAFQVHFNRHLFGCLPLDLTDLFSALRSPGPAVASPVPQVPAKTSNIAATSLESVQQNLETKLLLNPPDTAGVKCPTTSPQPIDLQSNELSNNGIPSDILDPTSQQQYPFGRVEWDQVGNAKVRFGDDSFIEKEISGLLSDGGNPDLTDSCNLLSALDLIPDSLLTELLKEERPWWVDATTNCPPASVTSQADQSVAESKCCPIDRAETSHEHSPSTEYDQHAADLVTTSADIDSGVDCFASNPSHPQEYFETLSPSSALCSDSWVPSDVVQQTWSSAVANERPLSSMEASFLTNTGHGQSLSLTDCPHHVLSDLTAALILPDVERRLKVAMTNSHHQRNCINHSSTQLDSTAMADCYRAGDSASKISDLRNGREVCCTLKRRRNASESSPSSPVTHCSMSDSFTASSFSVHSNGPVKLNSDCIKSDYKDGDGVGQLTSNRSSKCYPTRPSTVCPKSDDQLHLIADRPSSISSSNPPSHSATVVTSAPTSQSVLSTPMSPVSILPLKSTVNSKKTCHPMTNRIDTFINSNPPNSIKLIIPGQHDLTVSSLDVTAKSHFSQTNAQKRRRRQQQHKPTPSPIFPSSLRVIAVAARPLGTSSMSSDNFTTSGGIAENTVVFNNPVSSKRILLPRRNPFISCNSVNMPH